MIGTLSPFTPNRSRTRQYETIDRASRIESSTPHALVSMLYEELVAALDVMARAMDIGDQRQQLRQHERAASIIHALEASLDITRGGDLAVALASIYAQMRRRLTRARNGDAAALTDVRTGIANLAEAWGQIKS